MVRCVRKLAPQGVERLEIDWLAEELLSTQGTGALPGAVIEMDRRYLTISKCRKPSVARNYVTKRRNQIKVWGRKPAVSSVEHLVVPFALWSRKSGEGWKPST